ncbi:hypothetical protein NBRGN_061_00300 [Nocardia brasiliensis NBRC 14402]|uniref:hypothetical protein n=1 Tax=Nocardia brasiliensis TaxID=37326 RepID=UPI00031FDAD5|nr:hypothetical protein [Nocardia brasiliensis]ASF07396.1 hypothetical protein CEQ30_08525 [Nocardia brasiliensis]GAJ83148.1 hypothetical protein NBRGN_061_00300 [Nocardia brasiliensis NBRC 14402]SUB47294.1 Uncharacterised protein [Nocardia brasiliensis]
MSTPQSWRRFGGSHTAWIVFAVAALTGLFVLLSVTFADACYYLECRNTLAPFSFSLGMIVAGVGLSLIVGAVLLYRTGRRGRPRFKWSVIALAGVFVSSCGGWQLMTVAPFDDRPALTREARDIATVLGRMPGVHQVSTEIGGLFSAVVVLSEEASAAQTRAVIEAFRDQVWAATDFNQWETEFEVRRSKSGSAFRAGKDGFVEAPDRAGLWFALTEAFPGDEVKWTYRTWAHYAYRSSDKFERMDIGVGDISLKLSSANDFRAVSDTYRRLMREFPALAGARWQVGPAAAGSGSLSVAGRYPTEREFTVWQRLNEDRSMPHSVLMAAGAALPARPPRPRVTEQLHSRDLGDARLLAEQHLPIVAELGSPEIDYLVTTDPDDYFTAEGMRRVCLEQSLSMTVTNRAYPANDPPWSAGQGFSVRYRQC